MIISAEELKKTEISLSVNYTEADARIAEKRKTSQAYLKNSLGIK